MCLEDLQLGRGREHRKPVSFAATGGTPQLLVNADETRVGILISFAGGVDGVTVASDQIPDVAAFSFDNATPQLAFLVLSSFNPNIFLDVEHYGQIVTGQIWYTATDKVGTGVNVKIVEVFTNVKAQPKNR